MMAYHREEPTWLKRIRLKAEQYRLHPPPPVLLHPDVELPPPLPLQRTAPTKITLRREMRFHPEVADQLRLPPRNVFRHLEELKIPNVAYVAGAGPMLLDELRRIPSNAFVIACNRAIHAPFAFKIWMVFDLNSKRFEWFKTPPAGQYLKVFGYKLAREHPDSLLFTSRHVEQPHMIAEGGLQGGGTITSCALQLLYWAGVRTAIMLGSPLAGSRHYDGTQAQPRNSIWKQAPTCAYHILQMQQGGMNVLSMNATAMRTPLVGDFLETKAS